MYAALDVFFLAFHASWIAFILTGWIWSARRVAGIRSFLWHWYCPSTDWHWRVKTARGEVGLPNSYVNYCVDRITGLSWDPRLVDTTELIIGLAALDLSAILNWRDWRRSISKAR
jgi:hypothetical protein